MFIFQEYNKWIPINVTDASISNKSQIVFKKNKI